MNIESITLKDIAVALTLMAAIISPIVAVYKIYKSRVSDRLIDLEHKQQELDSKIELLKKETVQSFQTFKNNDRIVITGLIACLEGLVEQGCNGPVKNGLKELQSYLINRS